MSTPTPGPSEVYAIVPYPGHGVAVVAVGDLTSRLLAGDEDLEEALTNSALDSPFVTTGQALAQLIEHLRHVNAGAEYWD